MRSYFWICKFDWGDRIEEINLELLNFPLFHKILMPYKSTIDIEILSKYTWIK